MYWLKSSFAINSVKDLELLATFYQNACGELEVNPGNIGSFSIKWCTNPFSSVLTHADLPNYPFDIHSRLNGPDTVRAAAIRVEKLDPAAFEHPQKDLLLIWSDYVDEMVKFEMDRHNDIGIMFTPPTRSIEPLGMTGLALAIRLSKYATHAIPVESGFIVSNEHASYLNSVGLTASFECSTSLMVDLDDGFCSPWESKSKTLNYLNARFQLWKDSGYSGSLTSFYDVVF